MEIGKQLQLCRSQMKPRVSQAQAARDLGIERGTLSNLESGVRQPSLELLVKLADYYHTTTDFILERNQKTLPEGAPEIIEYLAGMSDRGREQLLKVTQILYEDDQELQQDQDLRKGLKLILGEATFAAVEAELPAVMAEPRNVNIAARRILDTLSQNLNSDSS